MFNRKGLTRPGDFVPFDADRFTNRTGATLAKGAVAMLDILGTQAETTNITPGDSGSVFNNLTPVTQAGFDAGFPVVVALEEVEDNQRGQFGLTGLMDVLTLSIDLSLTDANQGDNVAMVVSESAVAVSAAAVTAHRRVGLFLEDADATGGPTTKRVWWTGGIPAIGIGVDA